MLRHGAVGVQYDVFKNSSFHFCRSAASETIYQSVNDSGRPRTPSDVGVSSHQRAGSVRMRASSRDNPDRGSTTSINAIEERRPRRKIAQSDEPVSLFSSVSRILSRVEC